MKIFLDDFCFSVVAKPGQQSEIYKNYQQVDQIPDACDLISITFYNNNYLAHAGVIQQLLIKTRQLIIIVDEPTGDFYSFVQAHNNPKIRILSPVITNFSITNLHPLITWFGQPNNYYANDTWAKKLLSQLHVNFDRPKRFDCLLGTKKSHRDLIEQLYRSSTCQDQIVYSYFKDRVNQGIWAQNVDRVEATTHPIRMDIHGRFATLSSILPVDIYNQTFYSIVAETVCTNQYSQFTEKTAKPIVAKRPFVVFGGQYFLRNLRSLGFQTFGAVIDESYDDIQDEIERLTRAWHEVERLCCLDPVPVMQQLQSVLEHNRQHFLQTDWMRPITVAVQPIQS